MYKHINSDGTYRECTKEEINAIKEQEEYDKQHQYDEYTYSQLVSKFIHEKYTIDDEIAITRQRDIKPEEWIMYNEFCEECKNRARIFKPTGGDS